MSSNETLLVAAADDAYAGPASLALISAARSTALPVRCAILTDDFSESTEERVRAVFARADVALELADLPRDAFEGLPAHQPLHRATYGRLYLSRIGTTRRMLWLDADTVTVDSIDELLSVQLEGCVAGCVQDVAVPFVSSPLGVRGWRRLEFPPSLGYFNAGVMLIDVEQWTAQRIGERALDVARGFPEEAVLADQGPLNAVLAQRWLPLDARWNTRTRLGYALGAGAWVVSRGGVRRRASAAILHFGGPLKPWDRRYPPSPDLTAYARAWQRWLPHFPVQVSARNPGWYAHRLRRLADARRFS